MTNLKQNIKTYLLKQSNILEFIPKNYSTQPNQNLKAKQNDLSTNRKSKVSLYMPHHQIWCTTVKTLMTNQIKVF